MNFNKEIIDDINEFAELYEYCYDLNNNTEVICFDVLRSIVLENEKYKNLESKTIEICITQLKELKEWFLSIGINDIGYMNEYIKYFEELRKE